MGNILHTLIRCLHTFNLKAYLGYSSMKRIRVETMKQFFFFNSPNFVCSPNYDSATPGLHQQTMLFLFASLLYASTFWMCIHIHTLSISGNLYQEMCSIFDLIIAVHIFPRIRGCSTSLSIIIKKTRWIFCQAYSPYYTSNRVEIWHRDTFWPEVWPFIIRSH